MLKKEPKCEKCGVILTPEYSEEWRWCEECRGVNEEGSMNALDAEAQERISQLIKSSPKNKNDDSADASEDRDLIEVLKNINLTLENQAGYMRTIKNCLMFFVTLTIIGLAIYFVYGFIIGFALTSSV